MRVFVCIKKLEKMLFCFYPRIYFFMIYEVKETSFRKVYSKVPFSKHRPRVCAYTHVPVA